MHFRLAHGDCARARFPGGDRDQKDTTLVQPAPGRRAGESRPRIATLLLSLSRMTSVKPLAAALATLVLSAACTDDPREALDAEWQQMMRCSAYFTLRASSARESGTAAASRTTAASQVDAALASRYSYESR